MDISPARQLGLSNSLNTTQLNKFLQELDNRLKKVEEQLNAESKNTIRRSRSSKGSGEDVSSS